MDTNYKDKSKEEMDLLLSNFQTLTIDAKRNLLQYLQDNKSGDFADLDLTALENSIVNEESGIKDLKYLKNLGFSLKNTEEELVMSRNRQAKKMDVFTLVFGILLLMLMPWGLYGFYWSYDVDNYEFGLIFSHIINLAIGVVGLLLALRAAERIDKFWTLKLVAKEGKVVLYKGGVVKEEVTRQDGVDLSENAESISSYLIGERGSHELIRIDRPNLYFSQTLYQLKNLISKKLHQ